MKRMWTVVRHTLQRFRAQILGWGLGIAALGLIVVPFYGVLMTRQDDFMEMIEAYPPEAMAFFGGDAAALGTPQGFLGMYAFSMLPVIVGIFAVIAGSGLIAADEERGRLDLILAHPVGRTAFFFGRVLALAAAAGAIMIVAALGFCLPLLASPMGISWAQMALPFVPLFAQVVIYATLALLLSMILPSRGLAAALSGLVLVIDYFLSSLSAFDARLEVVAGLLPYAYYQGGEAMQGLNWTWLAALLGASAVMTLLAWWRFLRRDIRVGGEGSLRLRLPSFPGRRTA